MPIKEGPTPEIVNALVDRGYIKPESVAMVCANRDLVQSTLPTIRIDTPEYAVVGAWGTTVVVAASAEDAFRILSDLGGVPEDTHTFLVTP